LKFDSQLANHISTYYGGLQLEVTSELNKNGGAGNGVTSLINMLFSLMDVINMQIRLIEIPN
jgi:hypothetical protein